MTDPEHGWINLTIQYGIAEELKIDFSDVGPDSVGELKTALDIFVSGGREANVQFYLEPLEAILTMFKVEEEMHMEYFLDGVSDLSFSLNQSKFINALASELSRVVPLCNNPHWTNAKYY